MAHRLIYLISSHPFENRGVMTEKYKMLGHCVSPVIVYLLSTYTILYHGIPRPLKSQTPWKRRSFPKKSNFWKSSISKIGPSISTYHKNVVDIHETMKHEVSAVFKKRRTFYEMCSKDDLSTKVQQFCRIWVRMVYLTSLYILNISLYIFMYLYISLCIFMLGIDKWVTRVSTSLKPTFLLAYAYVREIWWQHQ